MKKVLVLVLSSNFPPYDSLMKCSMATWDSIEVENVETVFYLNGNQPNTDKTIYIPIDNSLYNMGRKTLAAFEWALKNKEFDYISRPQANAYIHKPELIKYIQTLPDENVFDTLEVPASEHTPRYGWGCSTLFSKDVVQKIVDHQDQWNHRTMEDVSLSVLISSFGIEFRKGRCVSINKIDNGWLCLCYGTGENFEFTDFKDIKKAVGQYWFRTKQDHDRTQDEMIMKELFKVLN